MEHVVFFTGADGAAQYRRTPSLEEAVRVVEHLRNVEGVEDSRVFSMTEVPLAFKTVYRVEIPGQVVDGAPAPLPPMPPMPEIPELGVAAPAAEAQAEAPAEPVMAAVPSEPFAAEPAPEPVSNGRRGNGFFAR
ncbi:MAG TPA: hypothetical protein VGX28_01475 [Frankiaceae bacterium]|nr:hypothetical protein [Frankiaceae bacterium]